MKNRQLKIHIIGGTGRMGTWLKQFLENQKMIVSVSGSRGGAEAEIKMANIVFICVPISKASTVIEQTAKLANKSCLLIDLSSVQTETSRSLKKTKLAAVAMHMLFGPKMVSLRGQKIVFSVIKSHKLINRLKKIFNRSGAEVIEMVAPEHDEQMAYIQNLAHFININLAQVLLDSGIDLCGRISTPVFLAQLAVLNRVVLQEPTLLTEIQLGNKKAIKVLKKFVVNQQKLIEVLENSHNISLLNQITKLHKNIESFEQAKIDKRKGGIYYGRTSATTH